MKTMRNLMIVVGALAVIMAGASPTLARDVHKRHFGYGTFAYHAPSYYRYGQRPHSYFPPAVRASSMMTWDAYGLRWDEAD